jgi:hypothetical protein
MCVHVGANDGKCSRRADDGSDNSTLLPVHNIQVDCRTGIMNSGLYLQNGRRRKKKKKRMNILPTANSTPPHESTRKTGSGGAHLLRQRLIFTSQ